MPRVRPVPAAEAPADLRPISFALQSGATAPQIASIQDGSWRARRELFDDAEWAVCEWAALVTLTPWQDADALVARLRAHFTDAQLVELTGRTALCSFWNKFNDALALDVEPGVREVALRT